MVSGANGYRCRWYTGCCYGAWVGSVNSKGGVFKLSCNYKLVQNPNGYRLPPNGGGAMGGWVHSPISVWCAPDKSQWPMGPTGIGVGATGGVAMGFGGCTTMVCGCHCTNPMASGAQGL